VTASGCPSRCMAHSMVAASRSPASGRTTRIAPKLLLSDISLGRKRMYGAGCQDIANLPVDIARAWLGPLLGTAMSARQNDRILRSLHARDLLEIEPALARLQVPTLIVWGTDDKFFHRKWAYWLRDTIPGANEVVKIDGASVLPRRASCGVHCRPAPPLGQPSLTSDLSQRRDGGAARPSPAGRVPGPGDHVDAHLRFPGRGHVLFLADNGAQAAGPGQLCRARSYCRDHPRAISRRKAREAYR
jgi:hypothetical protein